MNDICPDLKENNSVNINNEVLNELMNSIEGKKDLDISENLEENKNDNVKNNDNKHDIQEDNDNNNNGSENCNDFSELDYMFKKNKKNNNNEEIIIDKEEIIDNNNENEKKDDLYNSASMEESSFACNICFETAEKPIVTICGHLFCWPCIYKWMEVGRSQILCPVCKAEIKKENIIPLYGRGKEEIDPRKEKKNEKIPPRPAGQRIDPEINPNNNHHHHRRFHPLFGNNNHFGSAQFGDISFSAYGLFPGFFGVQIGGNNAHNHQPLPPEQERFNRIIQFVSSIVAILVILATIFLN
eukprot:TRINITY_DN1888_c1_g1_i1.p1 TRINITY_DN1888_c1_g1~~TRINITY_DN1888_c1_g1_i1.p1  ORF type:complete len:298 (-),score=106.39 TRINITY_DN1888_c1_g1_i1:241-1134(-)